AVTDALGHVTRTEYDKLNRVVTTIDALGFRTTSVLDADGNLLWVEDPNGNMTAFTYDELNRRLSKGNVTTTEMAYYEYDANDNITISNDRLARQRHFTYDALNRLVGEQWEQAGPGVVNQLTFTYDAAGHNLVAADGHGAYTFTYDALGRVATVQEPYGV